MDRGTAAYFKNLLVHRREALLDQLWDQYDSTGDPDPTPAQHDQMQALEAALQRIKDGHYGECTSCGLGIEHEVLEHAPDTSDCSDCAAGQAPWFALRRRVA